MGAEPAYDLTFSTGPGGEHAMLVGGEGRNPGIEHLTSLGARAGLKKPSKVIDQVRAAVSRFKVFADKAGVPARVRDRTSRFLLSQTRRF